MTDSADLRAAKRLLDLAKEQGFAFTRTDAGEDAPLRGMRESAGWIDEIVVAGFSNSCEATRRRRYSLIVPGGQPVTERVTGDALTVLHKVTDDWIT
ncbi:MAG: hypothetical protein ACRDSH_20085 [Pseudonocardiaceae bacterium]